MRFGRVTLSASVDAKSPERARVRDVQPTRAEAP
jgi:hypothetical protein